MALPTLSKTWRFGVNRSVSPGSTTTVTQSLLMATMVAALLGDGSWTDSAGASAAVVNPMTCVQSCGRVSGLGAAGVNLWTSDAEIYFGNYGGSGNRPWIVLQDVDGAQMMFTAVSSSNGVAIYWSPAGLFTGGTATAAPTAADAQTVSTNSGFGNTSSNITYKVHCLISTDGRSIRLFVCQSGNVTSSWHWDRLQNPRSGHANPKIFGYCTLGAGATSANHAITGAGGMLSGASSAAIWTPHTGGNYRVSYSMPGAGTSALGSQITSANEFDSAATEWPLWALGCYGSTTNARGVCGKPHDVWAPSFTRAQGDGFPDASDPGGARQFALLGWLVYPWNKSTIDVS